MKLSDLIIEHGPFTAGVPAPEILAMADDADALNELREELMAARAARELGERFQVYAIPRHDTDGLLGVAHANCPNHWSAEVEDYAALAELNQRAGEHAEVCR